MHHHYITLGLKPGATLEQITEAYRRLASELHPDKHPEEFRDQFTARMAAVNEAYRLLHEFRSRKRKMESGDTKSASQAFADFENKVRFGRGGTESKKPQAKAM